MDRASGTYAGLDVTGIRPNDGSALVNRLAKHQERVSQWLLENELVDEINLFTFPVVVGQGTRLFPDTGRDRALELVESRATPSGVTIQVYRSTGRPQYETATPDLNT